MDNTQCCSLWNKKRLKIAHCTQEKKKHHTPHQTKARNEWEKQKKNTSSKQPHVYISIIISTVQKGAKARPSRNLKLKRCSMWKKSLASQKTGSSSSSSFYAMLGLAQLLMCFLRVAGLLAQPVRLLAILRRSGLLRFNWMI